MANTLIERALVPDATRSRLLVVAGDVPGLPRWTLEDPEPVDTVRVARSASGITSPFLRTVRSDWAPDKAESHSLNEFDALPAQWVCPAGLEWLDFDAAGTIDAGPFGADVGQWIADLRSGTTAAARSTWARPGWFEATATWLIDVLRGLGRTPTGPIEQLGSWAVSSRLAVDTDVGRVIVKSVPGLFGYEPRLTQALAFEHPGRVPEVLAIDPQHGHLVMAAFGGTELGYEEPSRWAEGLVEMARIQQAWIGRGEEAALFGVEDRSLAVLGSELESIITDERAAPELDPATRGRLVANLPRYHDIIGELEAGPVPATLVHGDLHPWNVQRDGDRLVIFDWSDSCWSHPFLDVATFTVRTEDISARHAMRRAYLDAWAGWADPSSLHEHLRSAELLMEFHVAISWRRLTAIFEPGAHAFAERGVHRHLEMALAATDALDQPATG
ncbi:MAG TPA: aminoglycoside phosphotransferase family protein [Candidatus Limnocylindrales bacterium]|nr:aminoglycoside phosphotransferase family protein [Candidatus Limnocylindrales bacterium]